MGVLFNLLLVLFDFYFKPPSYLEVYGFLFAGGFLALTDEQVSELVASGQFEEVVQDGQDISQ
jgi:hypothetical protein